MSAQVLAAARYSNPRTTFKTPRGIEYEILAQVTSRLQKAKARQPQGFSELAQALDDNRRLWVQFSADLASAGNQLPEALRAQLLSLAQFIITQSEAVLRGRGSVDVIVDINISIMRGLAGTEPQS